MALANKAAKKAIMVNKDKVWRKPPSPPAVRPRDAATLILVRNSGDQPEMLMGERSAGHAFMPNRFVFPGGRVDQVDHYIKPLTGLRPEVSARLQQSCNASKAQALAMAAVRETFEETGLLLGKSMDAHDETRPVIKSRSLSWQKFFDAGVVPQLDVLDYVARAITPPSNKRRFHARFFMADATHAKGDLRSNGELINLHWVPIRDASKLKLPAITQIIIDEIDRMLSTDDREQKGGVPCYTFRYGRRILNYD